MATALNVQAWSKTPALNDNIDSTIGEIDDDIPVDALDDKQRGIMAALARFADDIGGALAAAGSANALEVTTNQVISEAHLTDGYKVVVRATAANSSTTVTIAVDGLSAKAIKTADGGLPTVGQITDGMYLMLFFDATADEFRAANLNSVSDTTTSGSELSSFRAHKNGQNQTISSNGPTKLTFGTEAFDDGSDYNTSTSTWTPPAGTALIHVQAMMRTSPPQDPDRYSLKLYRNGELHRQSQIITNESEDFSLWITTIEQVSGSDAFTVYVEAAYDSSYSIRGGSDESWFCGTMV